MLPRREAGIIPRAARLRPRGKDFGAIAQLGERYNGIVEVDGSIPSGSTKVNRGLSRKRLSPLVFGVDAASIEAPSRLTHGPR